MLNPDSYLCLLKVAFALNFIEFLTALIVADQGSADSCLQSTGGIDLSVWLFIFATEKIITVLIIVIIRECKAFPKTENIAMFTFFSVDFTFNFFWVYSSAFFLFGIYSNDCLIEGNAMAVFAVIAVIINTLSLYVINIRVLKYLCKVRNDTRISDTDSEFDYLEIKGTIRYGAI